MKISQQVIWHESNILPFKSFFMKIVFLETNTYAIKLIVYEVVCKLNISTRWRLQKKDIVNWTFFFP